MVERLDVWKGPLHQTSKIVRSRCTDLLPAVVLSQDAFAMRIAGFPPVAFCRAQTIVCARHRQVLPFWLSAPRPQLEIRLNRGFDLVSPFLNCGDKITSYRGQDSGQNAKTQIIPIFLEPVGDADWLLHGSQVKSKGTDYDAHYH